MTDSLKMLTAKMNTRLQRRRVTISRFPCAGRLNLAEPKTYDALGKVATTTNPRGFTSVFGYDAERHPTSTTTPSRFSYLTTTTYDKNGRAIETRAKTGNATTPEQGSQRVRSCLLPARDAS